MRKGFIWLLSGLLLSAFAFGWYQHTRIVRMEKLLGTAWVRMARPRPVTARH